MKAGGAKAMSKGALLKTIATERLEDEGLLQCLEQPGGGGDEGSEEGGCLHHPRSLPHQDPHQASHQGLREDDVRQGDQGEGQTSKDSGESLPSGCSQEADLSSYAFSS